MPGEPFVVHRREGNPVWFFGSLMTVKTTSENTGSTIGLVEQVAMPGFAPPLHVHHNEDELFYVMEGEATWVCGDRTFKLSADSVVFLPRAVPHAFRVEGTAPIRMLVLHIPGGCEHLYEDMGEPAKERSMPPLGVGPSIEEIAADPTLTRHMHAISEKYNCTIVGPPPKFAS